METLEILQTIQGKWIKQFGRNFRNWSGLRTFVHISMPNFVEVKLIFLLFAI